MSDTNCELGEISLAQNNFPQAIIHFTKSLNTEKSSAAHANRAYSYINLGELQLAKNDFMEVAKIINIQINETDVADIIRVDVYLREMILAKAMLCHLEDKLGNFYNVENIYSELIELFGRMDDNTILREDLTLGCFYKNRGIARLNLNKLNNPKYDVSFAVYDFANAFLKSNFSDFKEEILEIVKEEDIEKDFEFAVEDLTEANGTTGNTLYNLGVNSFNHNNYEEAITYIIQSLRYMPDNLGNVYYMLAFNYFNRSEELSKQFFYPMNKLKAKEYIEKAHYFIKISLELTDEKDADIYFIAGAIFKQNGDMLKAKEYFLAAKNLGDFEAGVQLDKLN